MGTAPVLLGTMLVSTYALLWIGLPIALSAWFRRRREEAIKRQIALTDAIHWQIGAVVSPVVENPLWGPWRIRIAAPLGQPAVVGTILAVTQAVLSAGEATDSNRYRIILTPALDRTSEEQDGRGRKPAEGWLGKSSVAPA